MKAMSVILIVMTIYIMSCATKGSSSDIGELEVTRHEFTVSGKKGAIYAIPSGTIQIKHCHYENCLSEGAPYPFRLIRIFFASEPHDEKLPIYSYLIDHPEGLFLVDGGGDPYDFSKAHWIFFAMISNLS